jgi:hypothetical protein
MLGHWLTWGRARNVVDYCQQLGVRDAGHCLVYMMNDWTQYELVCLLLLQTLLTQK